MVMAGSSTESCPRTFVFFRLMVSPKSLQAWGKRSISACSSCWVWVGTAALSANSMFLTRDSQTFVLALRQQKLKSLLSDPVRRQIPSDVVPKGCFMSKAKKIPKSVGARTHPCLMPLRMSKGLEELLLKCTVPFMFVWKDSVKLCNFGGQPWHQSLEGPERDHLCGQDQMPLRSMKAIVMVLASLITHSSLGRWECGRLSRPECGRLSRPECGRLSRPECGRLSRLCSYLETGATTYCLRSYWFSLSEHVSPEQSWSLRPTRWFTTIQRPGSNLAAHACRCHSVFIQGFGDGAVFPPRHILKVSALRIALVLVPRQFTVVAGLLKGTLAHRLTLCGHLSCGQFHGPCPQRLHTTVSVTIIGAGVRTLRDVLACKRVWGQVVWWPWR